MLVSFNVQNYRSFASKQAFSMVAGTSAAKREDVSFPSGNSYAPNLLRAACLFGPNGAGKSNLVRALDFFGDFIVSSAKDTQEGEKIDITSFKFDAAFKDEPSELEATFICGETLYQYGFAVDEDRVWGEWLFARPNAKDKRARTLFQREFDAEANEYVWNISKTYVKGERELWKKSTRDNALFLSTAIQLKAETFKEPFDWIGRYLRVVESPERLFHGYTAKKCEEPEYKNKILGFLRSLGVHVEDIAVNERKIDFDEMNFSALSEELQNQIKETLSDATGLEVNLMHKNNSGGLTPLDLREESDGTQVIFSIAGPWFDTLDNGFTLVIDELHNSMHPHALKFLVGLFQDPKINKNNAQLIFTSHETSVMAKKFMHQDQIWLVEKDKAEGSQLIPLSDFKVRDVNAFQKAYLDGRYGAVPKLKDFVDG